MYYKWVLWFNQQMLLQKREREETGAATAFLVFTTPFKNRAKFCLPYGHFLFFLLPNPFLTVGRGSHEDNAMTLCVVRAYCTCDVNVVLLFKDTLAHGKLNLHMRR